MTANTDIRLAPRQRLGRGLKYTVFGPVDITRGVLGIGLHTALATGAGLRARYRARRLDAPSRPRRRPLLIGLAAAGVLAVGAVAFSVLRRAQRPEPPSPLPPSVPVTPKP